MAKQKIIPGNKTNKVMKMIAVTIPFLIVAVIAILFAMASDE